MNRYLKAKKRAKIANKKLLKSYPWLWPTDWGGRPFSKKKLKYQFTFYDDIPKGWRKAFGKQFLEDIKKALGIDTMYIEQVKEKYGQLRFYYSGGNKRVDEVVRAYEVISENVCIRCGKLDVPMVNTGWVSPYCNKCFDKIFPKLKYVNYASEDSKISESYSFRRYSAGETETITVDISDYVRRIRK